MTKTREIEASLCLYVLMMAIGCGQAEHSPVKRPPENCDAAQVIRSVGNAVVAGDAGNLRSMLMTSRDLAWLQRASEEDSDRSFDERVYAAAAKDVTGWAALAKGGQVIGVELGPTLQNHAMEGFARPTDVIDDSVVLVARNGQTTRVGIQHLFLIDGCWRIAEIGNPRQH